MGIDIRRIAISVRLWLVRTWRVTKVAALVIALTSAAGVRAARAAKVDASSVQLGQRYDRFIITYRRGSIDRRDHKAAVRQLDTVLAGMMRRRRGLRPLPLAVLTAHYVRRLATGDDLVTISRSLSASAATSLMHQIAVNPAVVHIEPDVMRHLVDVRPVGSYTVAYASSSHARTDPRSRCRVFPMSLWCAFGIPNDPMYPQQWNLYNPVSGVNMPHAYKAADGAGITVAVVDTGITRHPDLDTSLADAGYDFTSISGVSGRETDGRVSGGWDPGDWGFFPSSWHGTHVAGTIAEKVNNGIGLAGMAYKARLLPVRVMGHFGGLDSDIADGIVWAAGGDVPGVPKNQHPAQVINLSLGGPGDCKANNVEGKAIIKAIKLGATVVVAAGNSTVDVSQFNPANCPGVIAVAAIGVTGRRAYYSNYGPGITIAAPGGGIYRNDDIFQDQDDVRGFVWSTSNAGTTVPTTPSYAGKAGTSQAAPHVTATIALLLSAEKAAGRKLSTPAQIRQILTTSARPFPQTPDHPIGAGIVDARAAIDRALAQ